MLREPLTLLGADMIFESLAAPLIPPPDDLSIPQFILDRTFHHPNAPPNKGSIACLIQEDTGRVVTLDELRARTSALAKMIAKTWNDAVNEKTVALVCPNHVDYPVCVWAILRLGGTVALISPTLTQEELVTQLRIANPSIIIAHADSLKGTLEAADVLGLDKSQIAVLDGETASPYPSIQDLIEHGSSLADIVEIKLRPGEAKTKIAFLCFSSGTTGVPKVLHIVYLPTTVPHFPYSKGHPCFPL
jgi:4-coumarate--CoA ligase